MPKFSKIYSVIINFTKSIYLEYALKSRNRAHKSILAFHNYCIIDTKW